MSLKKPSQLFKEEKVSTKKDGGPLVENFNQTFDKLSETFNETFDKFKLNVSMIEDLNDKVSDLSEEIDTKVTQNDLEDALFSHLLVVDENIEKKLKDINKLDLFEFKKISSRLTQIVENLEKNEFPKYKKKIIDTELKVEEKIDDLKEEVINLHQSSSDELQEKFVNFADVVDNNFSIFNQTIQETKKNVSETVETYKKLYKIIGSKGQKENEKLEEYSQVLEDFNSKFLDFKSYIEEEIKVYESVNLVLDEKLSVFENNLNTWKKETEKDISDLREDAIDDIVKFKKDIKSDISSLKTDVAIYENHNKKLGKEIDNLQEDTQNKLDLIENYIQNHHHDIEKLKEEIYYEVGNVTLGNIQENVYRLNQKLSHIEKVYTNIKPEDIVNEVINENFSEPPSSKNSDPLTPLDKNYVTLEQLQEHYRLFINRIQQQLSTLGGGGEVQLKYLDDIVGIATNPSAYDGKYLEYNHSIGKFEFTVIGEKNIIYVAKNGNDNNDGSLTSPKLTIKSAVNDVVAAGYTDRVIKVAPGTYIEDNPISLSDELTIIGHSLRETTVIPQNDDKDLFYVGNGNYISNMSFRGSLPNKAIVAFDPSKPRYIKQSPYIQNCTNFIPESIGMRIDGNAAIGPLKSMVLDSYTQYNQGGIGVSITNQGYAQLVSLFTICNEVAVYCGSGAGCDLTNSNSSFGDYGLVADGLSPRKFTGIVTVASGELSDTFVLSFDSPTYNIQNATYDHVSGMMTAYTDQPHKFSVGTDVRISGLGFTCPSGPGIVTYPSGNNDYVFNAIMVAPPRYYDAYNLIQANRQEIINTSYNQIAIDYPSFVNPNPDKCKRDIGYIVDSVSLDVRDYTNERSILSAKSYFDNNGNPLVDGLLGEENETITAFHKARDLMKLAITNNLTVKDLSVQKDPITQSNTNPSSCANIQTFIDNLVGIITTPIGAGNLNNLPSVSMASTVFSAYVGVSTLPHTYVSGGTCNINIVRPYDGHVIYFNDLFYTVKKLIITGGGSGYTNLPIITIDPPSAPWGIKAEAIPIIENGVLVGADILSSGRGYTSTPKVTISSGINTATAIAELVPEYYTIQKSTDIVNNTCIITINENVPFAVGVGTAVEFFKQSRVLATGHSFEFIGSGVTISNAIPFIGGKPPNDDNETDSRNGGLVVYTSTNQSGNFKIGDGVTINQNTSSITGQAYQKSLIASITPYVLSLGGF